MSYFFHRALKKISDNDFRLSGPDANVNLKAMVVRQGSILSTNPTACQDKATIADIATVGSILEATLTGYTARGADLGQINATINDTTNTVTYTPNTATTNWTLTGSETISGVLVYDDTANDATSTPVAFIDSGGINGAQFSGSFTINWTSICSGVAI